jgi:WS/DGAT/MGAT family acyltransferase
MTTIRERETSFSPRMSGAEALMWNLEEDPWFNPSGATLTLLDRAIDTEQFARRLRQAVARIPRLRERVQPARTRLETPAWVPDSEFNFDYHLRHVSLPAPGSIRQLYDLVTVLYEDPFDRTRPLWKFVIIDGVQGGMGAIFLKLHHTIADGIGLLRLAETYMETHRQAEVPPEVDLDKVIAEAVEAGSPDARSQGGPMGLVRTATDPAARLARWELDLATRARREAAELAAHPARIKDRAQEALAGVQGTVEELRGGATRNDIEGGSPLWRNRSRRRHLESVRVPLQDAKAAGKVLGGSVNDFFVAGAVLGAVDYHQKRDAELVALNISFVISTRDRSDQAVGGNAFTPTRVQVPGGPMTPDERFRQVRDRMAERRSAARATGGLAGLAGLAHLLPASIVARVARSQVAKMDFATSNMRAAPFPMYISGAEILESATMGPVAGTAFNLTAISYNGSLDMGVFIDPAAVENPSDLRDCLAGGYSQLLEICGMRGGGAVDITDGTPSPAPAMSEG